MTSNADAIRLLFAPHIGAIDTGGSNLPPHDAIYPDYHAPVIVAQAGACRMLAMQWGWPPFGDLRRPITNVRNLSSPMWRGALQEPARRCLVPVTAFCEYGARPDPATGRKRQHWFALRSGDPFAFAGIWRPTETGARFAFLTCEPNRQVGNIHPKAMPVMLTGRDLNSWQHGAWETARDLVRPFDDSLMTEVVGEAPKGASVQQPGLFG